VRARRTATLAPPLVVLLLLAGVGLEPTVVTDLGWVEPTVYHERVRAAASTVPREVGRWKGVDAPIATGAVNALAPNVLVSRRFLDQRTGRTVTALLVQSRVAGRIAGHYPSVCYPGKGWKVLSEKVDEWQLDGEDVRGTRYRFRASTDGVSEITVVSLLLAPGRAPMVDRSEFTELAQDFRRSEYGGATFQLLFESPLPEATERELVRPFLEAFSPVLRAVEDGVRADFDSRADGESGQTSRDRGQR